MEPFNVTIGGQRINNVYHFNGSNYVSLRQMVYALEGITHEQNEMMPREAQKVVWSADDKWAIFRITDRLSGELKIIEFSTEGLQSNTTPIPREVKVNENTTEHINFVFHDDMNMIGVRELSRLAGLENYLQWYNKDGAQYVDLRVEDPLYGHGSLEEAVNAIIEKQAGIPATLPGNFYQVLYGTANMGGKTNRYSGYMFSAMDAMQWLIQTGGNISFALQIRDTTNAESQVQAAVDGQWEIVRQFIQAGKMLAQCGHKTRMPRIFIGTPEENVAVSSYGTSGMIAIYRGIADRLKASGLSDDMINEMLGGIYFGSESAKSGIDLEVIGEFLAAQEAKLLWIPYFISRADLGKIKELAVHFDRVILQPGTFYNTGSYYENYNEYTGFTGWLEDSLKWLDIFDLIARDQHGKFGVELEFDMGLVTGRSDRSPAMPADNKQSIFMDYISRIIPHFGKVPIGIYSGGPNEQGYNNIYRNGNLHNDQNHVPSAEGFGTGSNYSDLYNGNLVYETNRILFSNRTNEWKHSRLMKLIDLLRR